MYIYIYICLHVKYSLFVSDFHKNLNFLDRFSKNTQLQNFMTIRPVEAELFHADRQTNMTKIKSLFAIFRTSLKKKSKSSPSPPRKQLSSILYSNSATCFGLQTTIIVLRTQNFQVNKILRKHIYSMCYGI